MHFQSCRVLAVLMGAFSLLGTPPVSAQQCPCLHFTVPKNALGVAIPRKLLLLRFDFSVYRVGPGGVAERAEDFEKSERTEIETDLRDKVAKEKKLELVALPVLDAASQARLDEHVALFEQVASAALDHAQGPAAWPQKVSHFDYGVGDGLRFLKQATGADAALIVEGQADIPTTSSHVLGALAIVAGVVVIPRTRAAAVAGVIDLDTGNVVWLNRSAGNVGLPNAALSALEGYPNPPAAAGEK